MPDTLKPEQASLAGRAADASAFHVQDRTGIGNGYPHGNDRGEVDPSGRVQLQLFFIDMNVLRIRQPLVWSCAAPVLCGLHCLLAPVLMAVTPSLSLSADGERWLLAVTGVLAIGALAAGVRLHRRAEVGLPVFAGLLLWGGALAGWTGSIPETVTTVLGSLLVTAGMLCNVRLRHHAAQEACACSAC